MRQLHVEIPQGWRAIYDSQLPPGEAQLQIIRVISPDQAPAAEYILPVTVTDDRDKILAQEQVHITVVEHEEVFLEFTDLPSHFQEGRSYPIGLQVINRGNTVVVLAPDYITKGILSSLPSQFTLKVGERLRTTMTLKIPQDTSQNPYELMMRIQSNSQSTNYTVNASRPVYRNLNTHGKTLTVPSSITLEGTSQGGLQDSSVTLKGGGYYDRRRSKSFEYFFSRALRKRLGGPEIFPQSFMRWEGPRWIVALGDSGEELGAFNDFNGTKKRVLLHYRQGPWNAKAFFARGWDYGRDIADKQSRDRSYGCGLSWHQGPWSILTTFHGQHDLVSLSRDLQQTSLEASYKSHWGKLDVGQAYQIRGSYIDTPYEGSSWAYFAHGELYTFPAHLAASTQLGSAYFVGPNNDQRSFSLALSSKGRGPQWSIGLLSSLQNIDRYVTRAAPYTLEGFGSWSWQPFKEGSISQTIQLTNTWDQLVSRPTDQISYSAQTSLAYQVPEYHLMGTFTALNNYYHFYYDAQGVFHKAVKGYRILLTYAPFNIVNGSLQFNYEPSVSYQQVEFFKTFGYTLQATFPEATVSINYQKTLDSTAPFSLLTLTLLNQLGPRWALQSSLQTTNSYFGLNYRWSVSLTHHFSLPVAIDKEPGIIMGKILALAGVKPLNDPVIDIDGTQIQSMQGRYWIDSIPLGKHLVSLPYLPHGYIEALPSPRDIDLTAAAPVQVCDLKVTSAAALSGHILFHRLAGDQPHLPQAAPVQHVAPVYEPFIPSDIGVILESVDNHEQIYSYCDDKGNFSFPLLRPGRWHLSVDLARAHLDAEYSPTPLPSMIELKPGATQHCDIHYHEVVRELKTI